MLLQTSQIPERAINPFRDESDEKVIQLFLRLWLWWWYLSNWLSIALFIQRARGIGNYLRNAIKSMLTIRSVCDPQLADDFQGRERNCCEMQLFRSSNRRGVFSVKCDFMLRVGICALFGFWENYLPDQPWGMRWQSWGAIEGGDCGRFFVVWLALHQWHIFLHEILRKMYFFSFY